VGLSLFWYASLKNSSFKGKAERKMITMTRRHASQRPSAIMRSVHHVTVGILIVQLGFSSSTALATDIKTSGSALNPNLVSTGLRNLGNTCYMNAQLQCAFHIPAVRDLLITEEQIVETPADPNEDEPVEEEEISEKRTRPEAAQESDALLALRELFQSMIQSAERKMTAVLPRSFCLRLGISPMVQQDSQEFWKLLLPAVNEEKLSDLYKGSFEDYITALDGSGRERRREELFLDLSLDISSRYVHVPCGSMFRSYVPPFLLS
jgi:hypothetical protein